METQDETRAQIIHTEEINRGNETASYVKRVGWINSVAVLIKLIKGNIFFLLVIVLVIWKVIKRFSGSLLNG